jgi:hypothetical protein
MGQIQYVKVVTLRNRKLHIYVHICIYIYKDISTDILLYTVALRGGDGMNQARDMDLVTIRVMRIICVKFRL